MEHLERFGLSQDPFRNEPQLDFYFESEAHAHAKQRLLRCLRQGKELCVLVGEVGSGTTTLARALFDQLDPDRFEAGMLVVARGIEPAWLRTAIARQLGIEEPATERAAGVRQLYERLVAIREQGRRAVVAIDEAQALAGSEALEDLMTLLNFEHDEARLLSAVLIGSPQLEAALAHLLGRVDLRVRLEALSQSDARAYIGHRLRVAGGDAAIFAPTVMDAIAVRASGIPRRINTLADNALFEAHLAGRSRPSEADVERAARDLPWARTEEDTLSGVSGARAAQAADDDGLPPAFPRRGDTGSSQRGGRNALDLDRSELADLEPDLGESVAEAIAESARSASAARARSRDPEPARAAGAPGPRRPQPPSVPELERTMRAEDFDEALLETDTPEHTQPGKWRTPKPLDETKPPMPDEEELDGLFVDLVDEV